MKRPIILFSTISKRNFCHTIPISHEKRLHLVSGIIATELG